MKQYPSQARLRELFDYDPEGFLVWKWREDISKNANYNFCGKKAGSLRVQRGISFVYTIIINGKKYSAKDLIWIYFKGCIPDAKKVIRKSAYLGFGIGNLYLGEKKIGTRYTPAKPRAISQKFQGVTEINNSGLFRVWQDDWRLTFSSEDDAATYYDNVQESKSMHRPNGTERRNVHPLNVPTIRHILQSKKKKDAGEFVGVFIDKRGVKKPFFARIGSNVSGSMESLGYFCTKEQAARAYNIAARERYGEHAVLNDIPDPLGKGDVF